MALDDFMESEVGLAVAVTAAATSPRVRNVLRQGMVYGLAGVMKVGDVVIGAARGAVRGGAAGVSSNGPASAEIPAPISSSTRKADSGAPRRRSNARKTGSGRAPSHA